MQGEQKTKKLKPFFKFDPITSIMLLLLVFLISQIFASLLISLYPSFRNWTEQQSRVWLFDSVQSHFFSIAIAEATAIIMIFWLIEKANITKKQIGIRLVKFSDIGWAFVAFGLYFVSFILIASLAKWLMPGLNMEQEQKIGFENASTNIELTMTFLSLVVLAPLAEEIMFRGFLFTSLRAKYRFLISAIVTSLLFGIAHLQFGANAPLLWVAAIDTFVLSMFLCYLREHTGGIWSPVFLHGIKNLLAFITLFGARIFF